MTDPTSEPFGLRAVDVPPVAEADAVADESSGGAAAVVSSAAADPPSSNGGGAAVLDTVVVDLPGVPIMIGGTEVVLPLGDALPGLSAEHGPVADADELAEVEEGTPRKDSKDANKDHR